MLALGYNGIDKRLPANEIEHSQTTRKKRKKKEKENRALTTFWLHIERIYEHSARLHIEHIESKLLNAFT